MLTFKSGHQSNRFQSITIFGKQGGIKTPFERYYFLYPLGHKHRVRAVRRGVKPNQAMLSPSSSTATSTSTSELSFATNGNNNNNNNHVKNNNSNKHQLLTATGSSSNTVVAETSPQQQLLPRTRRTSSGATLSRHRSSGCLSRHCHSTLSLSRTKSSSALNKVRSRSMNLLVMRSTGDDTSSSTSSDECDADVTRRGGAKRRSHQLLNGRPRSFSVRTASITKEEKKSEAIKGKNRQFPQGSISSIFYKQLLRPGPD